jgi:hypothetical protein
MPFTILAAPAIKTTPFHTKHADTRSLWRAERKSRVRRLTTKAASNTYPLKERKQTMYQLMNIELARRHGLACAVCAQSLENGIQGAFVADVAEAKGRVWIRMGHRTLALICGCLTPNMTKSALRRLVKGGIVYTANLNASPFDHTLWYSFTDFGKSLMTNSACREGEGHVGL